MSDVPEGTIHPDRFRYTASTPGPEMVYNDSPSVGSRYFLPLLVSPERHRAMIPVPIYEMRQTEACSVDLGQLRTIQQVSDPAGIRLPISAPGYW